MASRHAVEAVRLIFEDIRDRRFLKWLFADKKNAGGETIDQDVQAEIRSAWEAAVDRAAGKGAALAEAAIYYADADIRDNLEKSRESCAAYNVARDRYLAALREVALEVAKPKEIDRG